MPFAGHTPEFLVSRSDSKNPATTCKGITTAGRHCRRDISTKKAANGVLAVASVVGDSDEDEEGAAAFFCWQHKDQAKHLVTANANARQQTQLFPLQNRSSIDTLVARLGVLDVSDEPVQPPQRRQRESRSNNRPSNRPSPRRVNRPPTWDRVQGPLMSVPSDLMAEGRRQSQRPAGQSQKTKKHGFWASLCCGTADDDYVEVVRHKRRMEAQANPAPNALISQPQMTQASRLDQQPSGHPRLNPGQPPVSRPTNAVPPRRPLSEQPARPINTSNRQPKTETDNLISYIPNTTNPQTASLLLAELSKPISPHDDDGYIYIFWLTPEDAGPAPSSTASTLLTAPTRPEQGRRTSDVLRQYSVRKTQRPEPSARRDRGSRRPSAVQETETILLKIGRASNVHRRMTEWTRQCGYSLSLVRWYPYISSTPTPSPNASPANSRRPSYQSRQPSDQVRKVPHAHRVERLVHIELAGQRVMKSCDACGKEHREWFEVEATREGVRAVDEVVRRWVDWAEKAG